MNEPEYQEVRWLTMGEAQIKLRMSYEGICKLIEQGTLQAVRVRGRHQNGEYRIVDPGDRYQEYLRQLSERLFHIPLLTTAEAAEVMGTTTLYIQQLVKMRLLTPDNGFRKLREKGRAGCVKLFTVAEIRRYLWKREKRQRKGRRIVKIQKIVNWAKVLLDKQRADSIEGSNTQDDLDREVDALMKLQEPERTQSLTEFFVKLDKVEYMKSISQNASTRVNSQESPAIQKQESGTSHSVLPPSGTSSESSVQTEA